MLRIIVVFRLNLTKKSRENKNDGAKDVEITVQLKYLSNVWRTLEMPLIKCEINLILTWSENSVIVSAAVANQGATFTKTDKICIYTLCSSCEFTKSRQCKSIRSIKIRF